MALVQLPPLDDDGPEEPPPAGAAIDLAAILSACRGHIADAHASLDLLGVPRHFEDGERMSMGDRITELDAGWRRRLYRKRQEKLAS